jgi:hypothetical protein
VVKHRDKFTFFLTEKHTGKICVLFEDVSSKSIYKKDEGKAIPVTGRGGP